MIMKPSFLARVAVTLGVALLQVVTAWADSIETEYVDADGISRSCSAINFSDVVTELEGGGYTTIPAGWYVVKSNATYTSQLQCTRGDIHLIILDGVTLTVYSSGTNALQIGNGNLTIYGQSGGTGTLDAKSTASFNSGSGIYVTGDVTINGGHIIANANNGAGISASGNIIFNRGKVEATSSAFGSIRASNITLNWHRAADSFKAKDFEIYSGGSVTISDGKAFTDGNGNIFSGTISGEDITYLYGKTLLGTDLLQNSADNDISALATRLAGKGTNVTLQGRTLYKDGAWNTLCLPFDIENFTGTIFEDADIRALSSASLENGVLTLDFTEENEVKGITAGTPYIIKWANGSSIVNPTFKGVTVNNATNNFTSTDGKVQFLGIYSPASLVNNDKSNLFLGSNNALYWPNVADFTIGAFRSYFHLTDGNYVKSFVLNFGDEITTGINAMDNGQWIMGNSVYDLQGRRLGGRPTQPGIYVVGGRKIAIKATPNK